MGSPKNVTIHTMAQFFTMSNFFHKTPGEFKFGHNIGRVEIYEKNLNPHPIPPSYYSVTLKNLTIHAISQSLTLSNFFYKTTGKLKIGHSIGNVVWDLWK